MQENYEGYNKLSNHVFIHPTASPHETTLFVAINGDIVMGPYSFVGYRVTFIAAAHDYTKFGDERKKSGYKYGERFMDIFVEEGAWVASGAIIIGPCRIGKHAVVSAGSVVKRDVPEYAIVEGNPAKVVKIIAH